MLSSQQRGSALGVRWHVAVPEKHPRLRQDVALLRSWIDRKRIGDVRILLRGKPYLLDEYVRLGPNQTALEYAMAQDQEETRDPDLEATMDTELEEIMDLDLEETMDLVL